MITKKSFKKELYELGAKSRFLNWLFLLIIAFGVVSWITKFPVNLKSSPWLYIPTALLGALSFFAVILVWGWYSVWFRYVAYGIAKVISAIRRLLSSTIVQLVIILGLSSWFWVWRKQVLQGGDLDLKDILRLTSMLKILVLAAALFTMWKLFQSRKRIVICDFENFTDKKELDPVVKGLASICSNEMSWLWKLLNSYDDIHPDAEKKMAKIDLNLDVRDIGNDFEQIIGPDSSIKIGNMVTIPIRALYGFFRKILHGPMLTGGVHLNGNKFTLTASLKGGKFKGNWNINFEENETPPNDDSEKLIKLTERLVCRMLTDLSREITPRWKAMHNFIEGLRLFRETLLTEEKRKLNYIKAKDAFSQAVRDDEEFVQCYYNFGYIYTELESYEAAEAAFREALKKKSDYHQCYYQLAIIYYVNGTEKEGEEYSLFDAQWFCQQAVTICPSDPYYWDLKAVIQYYSRGEEVENEVIKSSMTGTMLAWRALCKSIIKGEKISRYKDTALICIRNLAVLTGYNEQKKSRFLFGQAIFLDPDNNDLHFERGKYFYRGNKKSFIKKANKAFKRVFEDDMDVNDPFSFWAFYMNVNAQLYDEEKDEKKKKEYKDVVDNGYIHFLDAAAEIIQSEQNSIQKKSRIEIELEKNELPISEVFSSINKVNTSEDFQKEKLLELSKYLFEIKIDKGFYKLITEKYKEISSNETEVQKDFILWKNAQIAIKLARLILEEERKGTFEEMMSEEKKQSPLKYAEKLLILAIGQLEKKYPNELKILGLHRHLAMAYLLSGSYEEALKAAREAARLSPYDPEVREVLGEVYIKLKDYRQAIKELQICFHLDNPGMDILQRKNILEKIGEAYIAEGYILRDPKKRKESFIKAAVFFKECHDIIEDKSYDSSDTQEYESYIETLGKTHFNLAYFYRELLQYDDAISHYQSALEMAKAIKCNADILETLLRMGWVFIEAQAFAEAEKTFNNADSEDKQQLNQEETLLINVEIAIGLMFSKVERAIAFGRNALSEDNELQTLQRDINTSPVNFRNIREQDAQVRKKKAQLSASYYECIGRLNWKQGERDEAAKQFEESIKYMPTPRVYLYLAEFYLREISESRIGLKETLLTKTRNACKLCRKTDLRQQYVKELDNLEKKLDALEK